MEEPSLTGNKGNPGSITNTYFYEREYVLLSIIIVQRKESFKKKSFQFSLSNFVLDISNKNLKRLSSLDDLIH